MPEIYERVDALEKRVAALEQKPSTLAPLVGWLKANWIWLLVILALLSVVGYSYLPRPTPTPPLPAPVSALRTNIQAAWSRETDADKKKLNWLVEVYKRGKSIPSQTYYELNLAMIKDRNQLLGESLPNTRAALSDYWETAFNNGQPMSPTLKLDPVAVTKTFDMFVAELGRLK